MSEYDLEQMIDEAREEIAELEKQLKASPWISVEDRLPEEKMNHWSSWVVVLRDLPVLDVDELADFSRYDHEKKQWPYQNETITHWMPIPELPKE